MIVLYGVLTNIKENTARTFSYC